MAFCVYAPRICKLLLPERKRLLCFQCKHTAKHTADCAVTVHTLWFYITEHGKERLRRLEEEAAGGPVINPLNHSEP
jgi:hypothetical protein